MLISVNSNSLAFKFKYYMEIKKIYFLIVIILMICPVGISSQNVKIEMDKASTLMSEDKFDEAYSLLQKITEKQAEDYSDTCAAYYSYYKGSCLYYLKKYQEAIPCLQKSIQIMDKIHYKNCDYLEIMYGMGKCYMELNDYPKAEEYFRRTILKGNYINLNCAIRNQTYREMAELYSLTGKPDFADICTSRIESEMSFQDSKDLVSQIDGLWDLYKAHYDIGKFEESINDLKKLRNLVEQNSGKNNKDYLTYSYLLGALLRYNCNRPQEAAQIHKEMIDIGKQFKTYLDDVCSAYVEYLRFLSENNKVDSIELILPSAIKYYTSTKKERESEDNLYEIIGNGLCDAKNYEDGVKYLEKKWEGKSVNSIKALDYLGAYYYYGKNDARKALGYYENAQAQIEGGLETNLGTKILILERLTLISQSLGRSNNALLFSEKLEPLLKQQNDDDYYSLFIIDWCVECINSGETEKAKELAGRAEAFLDKVSEDSKIRLLSQLGFVYIKTGQYVKSINHIKKGIDLAIKKDGEKTPILETLYHNLGCAYMLQGDYSTALSALNKSKNLQLELKGGVMQRTTDYINECLGK